MVKDVSAPVRGPVTSVPCAGAHTRPLSRAPGALRPQPTSHFFWNAPLAPPSHRHSPPWSPPAPTPRISSRCLSGVVRSIWADSPAPEPRLLGVSWLRVLRNSCPRLVSPWRLVCKAGHTVEASRGSRRHRAHRALSRGWGVISIQRRGPCGD